MVSSNSGSPSPTRTVPPGVRTSKLQGSLPARAKRRSTQFLMVAPSRAVSVWTTRGYSLDINRALLPASYLLLSRPAAPADDVHQRVELDRLAQDRAHHAIRIRQRRLRRPADDDDALEQLRLIAAQHGEDRGAVQAGHHVVEKDRDRK